MVYEWYTGSDSTLTVAKALVELEYGPSETPMAERVGMLAEALGLEQERNWRGLLYAKTAQELRSEGRDADLLLYLRRAEEAFDPLASTFMAVVDEYAWVLFVLMKEHQLPAADHVGVVETGLRLLAVLDLTEFPRWDQFMSLAIVGRAMRFLGEERHDRLLFSLALPLVLRAHHLFPEEESKLEDLVYLYHYLERPEDSARALTMLKQVARTPEVLQRVQEFARHNVIGGADSSEAM